MTTTIDERLRNARHHLENAQEAMSKVPPTTPGVYELLYAVTYLHDAVRDLAREALTKEVIAHDVYLRGPV
jgi:hypothetical protein